MSEEKKKEVNVTTRIKSIRLVDFICETISAEQQKNLNPDVFSFEQNVNLRIIPVVNLLEISYDTIVFSDEQKNKKLGEITTIGEFEILNLDELKQGENALIPTELLAMFVGIMIATVRGMLIVKSSGTILERAIIPILNPMDFFNKQ